MYWLALGPVVWKVSGFHLKLSQPQKFTLVSIKVVSAWPVCSASASEGFPRMYYCDMLKILLLLQRITWKSSREAHFSSPSDKKITTRNLLLLFKWHFNESSSSLWWSNLHFMEDHLDICKQVTQIFLHLQLVLQLLVVLCCTVNSCFNNTASSGLLSGFKDSVLL